MFCKITAVLVLTVFIFGFIFLTGTTQAGLDVEALVREVEQQYMGQSSKALTIMSVKTSHWERSLEMVSWSLERDYFLIRIIEPSKERDVSTLKRYREVWNYLPKVDRVIKVPPSMMGGSWMGSHITNDDLVKANHIEKDYNLRLIEETASHYIVECLPKPEAAVVWGKIIYKITKTPQVPQQIDYYDEEMSRIREIHFDNVQTINGRVVPMTLTVLPLEKPDEKTTLIYKELVFDFPLDETFFSLRNLKSP
jgi:outer membrane lipoprotein-sorting protein